MPFFQTKNFAKTISFRIVALFSLTFVVGVTLTFFSAYFEISYSLEKNSKDLIASKLDEISEILRKDGMSSMEAFLATDENRLNNAPFMIRVLSPRGESLYIKPSIQEKHFDFSGFLNDHASPASMVGWHALTAINDEDKFDIFTEKVDENHYLQIGKSSEDREAILENILTMFGCSGVLLVVLGGGLGLWYSRKILRPVRELANAISEIEKGDLSQRVKLGAAKDELYDLGATFNRMVDRIEALVRVMRESLDNVAHDIRTPLTRIKAVAEVALTSNQHVSLREALQDCAEDASGISEIVDQLMSISEAESGTMKLKREKCDITAMLNDIIEIYEFVALEKSISIKLKVRDQPLEWVLDRKRVKQAVANLLDNAIKFSEEKSKIEIEAGVEHDRLVISVKDEGQGIPKEDLPRIWDRLFRGDRSRTTKGAGLGLSIVRAIVTAHKGVASAEPNPERGTRVSVEFPASSLS